MVDIPKRAIPLNYDKAWRYIRPFVSFRLQKRKGEAYTGTDRRRIRKYAELIHTLKDSRETRVYRPKNKNNLKKVQEYAQHPTGFRFLNVAFVPTPKNIKTRIRVGKQSVTLSGGGVRRRVWLFSSFPGGQARAIIDPDAIARAILRRDRNSNEFAIACGEHEVLRLSRDLIGEQIREYVAKYGEIQGNHNVRNWLIGIIGYEFGDQATLNEYKTAMGRGGEKRTKKRKPPKGRENER